MFRSMFSAVGNGSRAPSRGAGTTRPPHFAATSPALSARRSAALPCEQELRSTSKAANRTARRLREPRPRYKKSSPSAILPSRTVLSVRRYASLQPESRTRPVARTSTSVSTHLAKVAVLDHPVSVGVLPAFNPIGGPQTIEARSVPVPSSEADRPRRSDAYRTANGHAEGTPLSAPGRARGRRPGSGAGPSGSTASPKAGQSPCRRTEFEVACRRAERSAADMASATSRGGVIPTGNRPTTGRWSAPQVTPTPKDRRLRGLARGRRRTDLW